MSIGLNITDSAGNQRAFESAENIADSTRAGIEKAYWRSGKALVKKLSEQVIDKSEKSGITYIRKDRIGRRRRHQASAAGESPANRRGFYRRSTSFIVQGSHQLVFGNSAPYSGFLEGGTSRMKARPGLGNAVRASERDIIRNFAPEMEDQI